MRLLKLLEINESEVPRYNSRKSGHGMRRSFRRWLQGASVRREAIIVISIIYLLSFNAMAQDVVSLTKLQSDPANREFSGAGAHSEEAQGLAIGPVWIYYSNVRSLYKMNRWMTTASRKVRVDHLPFGSETCHHVGGLDVYDDELYVALDNCSDKLARIAVFDLDLDLVRHARIHSLANSFPWVSVNPLDSELFYTSSSDAHSRSLFGFPRQFETDSDLRVIKAIHFSDRPSDVLDKVWRQGADFAPNGMLVRVVDDAEDEDSLHTGLWIYELDKPIVDGSQAKRVGFFNIQYNPDIGSKRSDELEDVDIGSIGNPGIDRFASDLHLIYLSNEPADEDDVTIMHFSANDFDSDGINDFLDNCFREANSSQTDRDNDGYGGVCDPDGELHVGGFHSDTLPVATPPPSPAENPDIPASPDGELLQPDN